MSATLRRLIASLDSLEQKAFPKWSGTAEGEEVIFDDHNPTTKDDWDGDLVVRVDDVRRMLRMEMRTATWWVRVDDVRRMLRAETKR